MAHFLILTLTKVRAVCKLNENMHSREEKLRLSRFAFLKIGFLFSNEINKNQ